MTHTVISKPGNDLGRLTEVIQVCGLDSSFARQLALTFERLGLTWSRSEGEANRITIEPVATDPAGKQHVLAGELSLESKASIDWLRRARDVVANDGGGVCEGEPDGEPRTVSEIASTLLSPYRARDGQVRFAGCTLDERPHLRLGCADNRGHLKYQFFGADGVLLDDEEIDSRGFRSVHSVKPKLRVSDRATIDAWVSVATAETDSAKTDPMGDPANCPLDVTVVWSRRAAGKIVIRFGPESNTQIVFDGWARDYENGRATPPKFKCPLSGLESYELIRLDDGTITVPEAVATCEVSGTELMNSSMATCPLTGKRVDQSLLYRCGATERLVLKTALVACDCCGGLVVPGSSIAGICQRCKHFEPIERGDSRIKHLLRREPDLIDQLGRGHWTGWVSEALAVLVASGLRYRRLIVFDPRDGTVLRTGVRNRLLGKWKVQTRQSAGSAQQV